MNLHSLSLRNSQSCSYKDVPVVSIEELKGTIVSCVQEGKRLLAFFAQSTGEKEMQLYAVLGNDKLGTLSLLSAKVENSYPSITDQCAQAHWFEREIAENWGISPKNHPWLKPIRFIPSYREGQDAWNRSKENILPCVGDYYQVQGEEIHEVAVGPVHAGVIEPGHFRFQCHGEWVYHLEISLGYQHRGIEKELKGGPTKRTLPYMETMAGDTSIGHSHAYLQMLESLANCQVSQRAQALRGIALELERLANHTGDLGALANDVGFLPTANYCGRIRGDFLNMSALLCGSRFGRNFLKPGGVAFDLEDSRIKEFQTKLENAKKDVTVAAELLLDSPSVLARFEDTGVVSKETARELGLVGVAARASGLSQDIRKDYPFGIFSSFSIPVAIYKKGDVFARAYVRWIEIQNSIAFIQSMLISMPKGKTQMPLSSLAPDKIVVSLTEGWRGEICHVAKTDEKGQFSWYKVCDPSFHNWMGLSMALRNQQISDFPLCNKSFNLSYCGHDL
ncbi:MAG: NADH-quinone oxidoreductase subunit C [Candidatus Brocadiae bacterium]|nr:NADH-quinone oxidoreductase subunit C [Candidatus Brocadiia bacterium]